MSPVSETGLFNGMYMQMDGATLTQPKKTTVSVSLATFNLPSNESTSSATPSGNDASTDVNTFGWTDLMHDARSTPALDVYPGTYMNPSSSVDVAVTLQQVRLINPRGFS